MSGPTELLRHARQRAESLRARYRAAGFWSPRAVDVVRLAAARHPSRLALQGRGIELTYAALDERIDRACHAMAEAGVTASTPIVLVVGNDVDCVVAVHAAMRLDAVVLLVPRSAGAAQVADIVARTGAGHGVAPNWAAVTEAELASRCIWIEMKHGDRPGAVTPPPAAASGRRAVLRAVHLGHHVQAERRDPLAEHVD